MGQFWSYFQSITEMITSSHSTNIVYLIDWMSNSVYRKKQIPSCFETPMLNVVQKLQRMSSMVDALLAATIKGLPLPRRLRTTYGSASLTWKVLRWNSFDYNIHSFLSTIYNQLWICVLYIRRIYVYPNTQRYSSNNIINYIMYV